MTYYESYRDILRLNGTVEQVKEAAKRDVRIAIFLGNNPDRLKAIEDAMNKAIEEDGRLKDGRW